MDFIKKIPENIKPTHIIIIIVSFIALFAGVTLLYFDFHDIEHIYSLASLGSFLSLLSIIIIISVIADIYKSYNAPIPTFNDLKSNWKVELKKHAKIETDDGENYLDWKKRIRKDYKKCITNINDETQKNYSLYMFLNKKYRFNKNWADTIKTIMLPGLLAVVVCFTQLNAVDKEPKDLQSIILGLILTIFVILLSVWDIARCEAENDFINDFFKAIFDKERISEIETLG